MDWLNHPSYVSFRDGLISQFQKGLKVAKRPPHVIFVCGGGGSTPRGLVLNYLRKWHQDKFSFYAETAWNHIVASKAVRRDSLQLEVELGKFADLIIVLTESAGSIAELGAFSVHSELRKKTLAVIEEDRLKDPAYKQSFIYTGPITVLQEHSAFKPIYCSLGETSILSTITPQLEERLHHLPERGRTKAVSPRYDLRSCLFILADVLSVIGPAPESHCSYFLHRILGGGTKWPISEILAFGIALGILGKTDTDQPAYYRHLIHGELHSLRFATASPLELPRRRAQALGILSKIESAAMYMRSICAS